MAELPVVAMLLENGRWKAVAPYLELDLSNPLKKAVWVVGYGRTLEQAAWEAAKAWQQAFP